MLEKTRIHRAMLKLSDEFGFSVADLQDATEAAEATVRKTVERAVEDELIAVCGKRASAGKGGPQKLYRLTETGRRFVEASSAAIYARLLAAPLPTSPGIVPGSTAPDELARDALEAARETLASLAGVAPDHRTLLARLAMARAELDEAARDRGETGLRAVELRQEVSRAIAEAGDLPEDDSTQRQRLCDALKTRLTAVDQSTTREVLDALVRAVPALRRDAGLHATEPGAAEALVCRALGHVLNSPLALSLAPDAAVRLAVDRLCADGDRSGDASVAIPKEMRDLMADIQAGTDRLEKIVYDGLREMSNEFKNDITAAASQSRQDAQDVGRLIVASNEQLRQGQFPAKADWNSSRMPAHVTRHTY